MEAGELQVKEISSEEVNRIAYPIGTVIGDKYGYAEVIMYGYSAMQKGYSLPRYSCYCLDENMKKTNNKRTIYHNDILRIIKI